MAFSLEEAPCSRTGFFTCLCKMSRAEVRGASFMCNCGDHPHGEETLKFILIPAFTLNGKQPDYEKDLNDRVNLGGWLWVNETGR